MKYFIILIIVAYSGLVSATTFEWDHDCADTDQFNLYYAESSGDDKYRVAYVSCPAISITLPAFDGYFM